MYLLTYLLTYVTPDLLPTFKVKGSEVKVTASRNANENLLNH